MKTPCDSDEIRTREGRMSFRRSCTRVSAIPVLCEILQIKINGILHWSSRLIFRLNLRLNGINQNLGFSQLSNYDDRRGLVNVCLFIVVDLHKYFFR